MSTIGILSAFGIGFISWFATGVDDLFMLMGLLKGNPGKSRVVAIGLGQLTGVIGLLVVANSLLTLFTLPQRWLEVMSGVGFIVAAIFITVFASKPQIKKKRWVALTALVTYLSFAADDFLVITGCLIPLTADMRAVLSVGFVTGWMISFILALAGAQIKVRWLEKVLPVALVILGLKHLLFACLE